ncbi:MAG: hypothetical protein H0X17_25265 [Deltaproteobacteria bacterium]|nr:hypothetical protein [Deltaproteobacteria bacterium]
MHFPGCALIVSHDRWFLDRVATGILAFEGDGQVTFYEGTYSFYVERRPKPAADPRAKEARGRKSNDSTPPKPAAPKKLTFKEARELEGIEGAIAAAEARVAELEATLADPALFANPHKDRAAEVQAMVTALDAARAEVERLFARWQELDAITSS